MTRFLPAAALLVAGCTASLQPIPGGWTTVPAARPIASVALDADGRVTHSVLPVAAAAGPVRTDGRQIYHRDAPLTEAFDAIDSYDLSVPRQEVVFSARREAGGDFDIGLVGLEGGRVVWVPDDPADEVLVRWAPRGNKVSYVVRAHGGDVVRTLHIPSSAELSVPFPMATIHALAWDPQAERYAVAYSTPDASDRVEVVRYGGEERRVAVAPAERLAVALEPLTSSALLLRPVEIAYGESLPVVVWRADDFAWSDARAALLRGSRMACVVTRKEPDAALWTAIGAIPWVDSRRAFLVGATPDAAAPAEVLAITGDPAVPAGFFRRSGGIVATAPAVVQSFAAAYIPHELERMTPRNASSP